MAQVARRHFAMQFSSIQAGPSDRDRSIDLRGHELQ
jgi:hypothetical protein